MNLLRDRASNIQFEAFHVFKAFVANPNKPQDISMILYKNKTKLVAFLQSFQSDRDDAQFSEEKSMLIE
jgi:calcium binding protein 39